MLSEESHRKLERIGAELSKGLFLPLIGILLLLGVPISGLILSVFTGAILASLVGGGIIGVMVFLGGAFAFALFLSIYVWSPHVGPAIHRAIDALSERN